MKDIVLLPKTINIAGICSASCLAYLNGDNLRAMKSLGRALHYIQNKSVSKGFLVYHMIHGRESLHQHISEDAIKRVLMLRFIHPHYVKKIIKSVELGKNIDQIMNQDVYCSAQIFRFELWIYPETLPTIN